MKATAEWQCSRCATTNRKLVDRGQTEVADVCLSCHQKHLVTPANRPPRWAARAA